MFQYNKECRTKNGEILIPLIGEGEFILCSNSKGKSVYKKLSDFETDTKKETKNIVATPKQKITKSKEEKKVELPEVQPVIIQEPVAVVAEKHKKVISVAPIPKENENETKKISKTKIVTKKTTEIKEISKDNSEEYI